MAAQGTRSKQETEALYETLYEQYGKPLAWIIHGSSGRVNKKEHRPVGCGC